MNIIDIINQRHLSVWQKFLDCETKDFLKAYGQLKGVDLPKIQEYNQQLASTKSKAQLERNREKNITTGISLIVASFVFLFLSASTKASSISKLFDAISIPTFFIGGTVVLIQISTKSKYNDSKDAKKARSVKKLNDINIKHF